MRIVFIFVFHTMKTVHPKTAYEKWRWFKVQKICKRNPYTPRTFNEPRFAVVADLYYPDYDLYGWTYVSLGMTGEPTTYATSYEAKQFMKWIKDWCDDSDKVRDVK